VDYDELSRTVRDEAAELAAASKEADSLRAKLAWYDGFVPEDAVDEAAGEVDRLSADLHGARSNLAAATEHFKLQRVLRAVSWHPTALLVKSVRESRRLYKGAKVAVADLSAQEADLDARRAEAQENLLRRKEEGDRHATFERSSAAQRLEELEARISALTPAHEELARKLGDIDRQLEPLLVDLELVENKLRRVTPGNQAVHRLNSVKSRLEKRVRQVKRKGTMVVELVIIDGSNLRFDDRNGKIGLFALRPLCAELLKSSEVLVVFDATILRYLGYPDEASLAKAMLGTPVKVVASKTEADEFILNLADDQTTYVLSNDKYPEYTHTAAMEDERVLPVEIVDSLRLVCVPMLDIKVPYERTR